MRYIFALLFLCNSALAGGRGAHGPDMPPPTAVNITAAPYNAICNGIADDSVAFNAWAVASAGQKCEFYIPAGKNCVVSQTSTSQCVGSAKFWGYGATLRHVDGSSSPFFGGVSLGGQVTDRNHSARINTVSAASPTVTLANVGDASKITVPGWLLVAADNTQCGGYPTNNVIFEYRLATALNGSVVTLDSPLRYSYSSTYPSLNTAAVAFCGVPPTGLDQGGQATIWSMATGWDTCVGVYGLTILAPGQAAQVNFDAKCVTLQDVVITGPGPTPSLADTFNIYYSYIGDTPEFDKQVSSLSLLNSSTGSNIQFQSTNIRPVITGLRSGGTDAGNGGTPGDVTYNNSNLTYLLLGASYGTSTSVTVNGGSIGSIAYNFQSTLLSWATYSTGVLSYATANQGQGFPEGVAWLQYVIGGRYCFGSSGQFILGSCFTVTDITQDGSGTHVTTDLIAASMPSPQGPSGGPDRITTAPPKLYVNGCVDGSYVGGVFPIHCAELSQPTAQGKRWGEFSDRTYTGNFTAAGFAAYGTISQITVNVTTAYVGAKATVTVNLGSANGANTNQSGVFTQWNCVINLKVAGVRTISPGANSLQLGDSCPVLPAGTFFQYVMAPALNVSLAGDLGTLPTFRLTTNLTQ